MSNLLLQKGVKKFTQLSDVPHSYAGFAGQVVVVNNTETGLTFSSASGAVSSVSAANASLTISPTTGAVLASLNLSHANTWLALQTFSLSTISITGGTNTYVLSTNGSGTLSWVAQSGGGSPAGSNGDIQFNNSGAFGGVTVVPVPNGGSGVTGIRTDIATTGNVPNQAVASNWLNYTGTAQTIISGFVAQANGVEITITNENCNAGFYITNQSFLSTAANRVITPTGTTVGIHPGASAKLRYNTSLSRWIYVGAVVFSSGTNQGGMNFSDGVGGWGDDGTNIFYNTSLHRLQLNNVYVTGESDLGGNTRLIGNVFGTADGLIPFSYTSAAGSGTITADTNLYWDNVNKRLGVGTQSPAYQLHVIGASLSLSAPISFSATLQSETLANPPSDSLALFYGPLDISSFGFTSINLAGSGYNTSTTLNVNYLIYSYRHDALSNTWESPSGFPLSFTFPYPLNTSIDNGSAENPSYSGYNNNDTVSAVVYGYNNTLGGGILYTSAGISLPTINLANNPSGIDWFWTPETLADGNSISGYIIEITDQTTSTVYSYNVGTATNYADMNVGGTVSYTPFFSASIGYDVGVDWSAAFNGDGSGVDGYVVVVSAGSTSYFDVGNTTGYEDSNVSGPSTNPYQTFASQGGYTSSGQAFSYDMFVQGVSPSGGVYFNDNGNGYNINISEGLNNGTLFWVQHNISGTSGNSWRELENDFSGNAGRDGTGDIFFYQTSVYSGTTTTTPNHYGIQSDGSTLNRDYQAYTQNTSPGVYYSSLHTDSSIFDPNDGQYYSITYTYSTIGSNVKVLEQINGAGFNDSVTTMGSSGTFYQDGLGGNFFGNTTVTPTSVSQPAAIFENDTITTNILQVILNSTLGPSGISFRTNGNETGRMYTSGGAQMFFISGGINFQNFAGQAIPVLFGGVAEMDNNGHLALGSLNPSAAVLTLASGTTSITQLLLTNSTLPITPVNGGMEFDGTHWFGSDNTTRRMFIQTISPSVLTNHKYPQADANGRLIDGFIDDTYLGSTAIVTNFRLNGLFTLGLSLSTGQNITMGGGGAYAGGFRTTFGTGSASLSLTVNNHSPIFVFTGSTSGRTLTLPTAASISGTVFEISNEASVSVTVATTSSQNINIGVGTVTSLVLQPGDRCKFIATASSTWDATSSTRNIQPVANGGTGQTSLLAAGIVTVVASVFEKAETGSDANILTYTTGGTDEFLNVQVATDVSAISGTSIVVTVTWKDSNNSTATSTLTITAIGDGTINIPINGKTATNVVVSSVFVGVSTAYKVSAVITRLK